MNHGPRVSVIIPCYNLGRFVEESVDSVLKQTYTDFEILVVNDGSTDGDTRLRLDGLERPQTRVIHSENRGLSGARNLGILHSTGRYICSVDADDRLAPNWLDRAVALLDGDSGLTFVSHWLETFGDERWDWKPGRCDLGMLLDFNVVNGAALFRREIVDAIGGFDESMREGCEDWEFWIRVTEAGYRGAIVPEVHYQYRRRSDSMSRTMNDGDTHLRLYRTLLANIQTATSSIFSISSCDVSGLLPTFVNMSTRSRKRSGGSSRRCTSENWNSIWRARVWMTSKHGWRVTGRHANWRNGPPGSIGSGLR